MQRARMNRIALVVVGAIVIVLAGCAEPTTAGPTAKESKRKELPPSGEIFNRTYRWPFDHADTTFKIDPPRNSTVELRVTFQPDMFWPARVGAGVSEGVHVDLDSVGCALADGPLVEATECHVDAPWNEATRVQFSGTGHLVAKVSVVLT